MKEEDIKLIWIVGIFLNSFMEIRGMFGAFICPGVTAC